MLTVAQAGDVVLGPGDLYFGRGEHQVRTLLGSCVGITLWHPRAYLGGMCHVHGAEPRPRESLRTSATSCR